LSSKATQMREFLKLLALRKTVATYGEISSRAGFWSDSRELFELLYIVGKDCLHRGEPPLNALIVKKYTRRPGSGYWRFLRENNISYQNATTQWKKDVQNVYDHSWNDSFQKEN